MRHLPETLEQQMRAEITKGMFRGKDAAVAPLNSLELDGECKCIGELDVFLVLDRSVQLNLAQLHSNLLNAADDNHDVTFGVQARNERQYEDSSK